MDDEVTVMRLPEVKIERIELPRGRRILVTSDIHGHCDRLKRVLDRAGYCRDDVLVVVGDIIEKGPHSIDTLRFLMRLSSERDVICLIGNVDAWRLHMINDLCESNAQEFVDYLNSMRKRSWSTLFDDMTRELGILCTSPTDVLAVKDKVISHFHTEFDFLASLPTIVETQDYIFVHGGLRERMVSDNAKYGLFDLLKYDNFMNKTSITFDKYVIVGHWPVSLYDGSIMQLNPIINRKKHIISIDGGCGIKTFGQLNLVIIPETGCDIDNITHMSTDELPLYRALDAQSASDDPINISWADNQIKLLERLNGYAYIEHVSTSRRMWLPDSYIRDDTHCNDYTDYKLPVEAGDTLALIADFANTADMCPDGVQKYFVKRGSVNGWYNGRIEKI
ncbi:MAG: hypothetical protein HFE63_05805 [Clostridiales bacterium]|nr:hypothetical protein [Clostridiales bacterium]